MAPQLVTPQLADYRDAAIKKFNSLLGQSPDFWKAANAFDTMIDFLEYCAIDRKGDAAQAAQWVIGYSDHDPEQTWFDDYGWWTIATTRAVLKTSIFDEATRKQLAGIRNDCWSSFTKNAPYVWERRAASSFGDCAPAVGGGVWNGYWLGTDDQWTGPKIGDPTAGTLLGIQNTVTNAVFLLSAQLLSDNVPAEREFAFLDAWLTMPAGKVPLLWEFSTTQALVRERATHYKNRPAPGFDPQWAWAGDQGLTIGALVGQAIRNPGRRAELVKRAAQLIEGVKLKLVENDVLNYWTLTGKPPSSSNSDPTANYDDYATGSGVFWRYMLRVWELGYLKIPLGAADFRKILQANAQAAMGNPDKRTWPNNYQPATDWVTLTNDLAVLVAACTMLKSA
jgi:hypothetical protein